MKKIFATWAAAAACALLTLTGTTHAADTEAAKPKYWHSTATCGVEKIGTGDHGKTQLKGTGKGKSKGEAERAAQRNVQEQVAKKYGKGYRTHHCTFRSAKR
ncbi:hypothetical protein [Streptomyces sp. NPDC005012]|uniref:hypothetical protein n=1 Tax=Streptomyces sp. NPDC005012 TaxID=3154558 RepID=UPI0033BD43CD